MYNKEVLKKSLQEKVGTVVFTKADGSERTMRCTLQSNFLPPKSDEPTMRGESTETLSVWDIDASGWRSFRIDSIVSTDI